jgi:phenylacetate-CoA ligase
MPGKFLRDYHFVNFENAAVWRHFHMHGYTGFDMRRMVFTGRLIVPVERKEPPFWIFDKRQNTLVLSSLHMAPENEQAYIEEILRFKPQIMAGYSSAICMLAEMFERHGLKLDVTAVFPGSETVFDHHRQKIETIFNTDVYDWYGQQERVSAIGQCEYKTYHVIEDYSITELLNLDGQTEIVGTHLENYKMPLLRYRTGDTVLPRDFDCPCGRRYRTVDRVLGRMGQYILTPDGRKITVVTYMLQHFHKVHEAQFVQDHPDALTVKLVTADDFNDDDRQNVVNLTKSYISPTMDIHVQLVNTIPRTRSGKFMSVINNLSKAELN